MQRFILLAALVAATCGRADVSLAPLFNDHGVLQRDKPLPIWGWAEPGEHVTVTFGDQKVGATADTDGKWFVMLSELHVSATPAELVVEGKNTLRVQDLLVGDVWLCSGQSNMEFTVQRAQNADAEIANANLPLIRHIKIKRALSDTPTGKAEGAWNVCSPATVAEFSAVGFFFARDLQPRLDVPIGLINSTWGGTPIEAWLSAPALRSDPAFAVVGERWKQAMAEYPVRRAEYDSAFAAWKTQEAEARARGKKFTQAQPHEPLAPGSPHQPSGLFNGMISPLLPYALRGVLWYQGETNASRANEYGPLFATLIRSWRDHFGQGELPFLWVQLANYKADDPNGTSWAFLREAQTKTLSLPSTGQAVIIDIGDRNDIHPRNKQEVGRRLALLARAKVYNMPVDFSGPTFERAEREGSGMRIYFSHAGTALTAHDKPLQSFQIAGTDRKFYPATAKIDRDTVVVSAPQVREPLAVRYAWSNAPEANLYNGAGLPAVPFRTDSW